MNQTFSDIKCEKWSEWSILCIGEPPNNGHILDLTAVRRGGLVVNGGR